MPVIKSAKKQMRKSLAKKARNYPVRSEFKTAYKKGLLLIKEGKVEELKKFLPHAYKIFDVASKKGIIHHKNAANKKSKLALELNKLEKGGAKKEEVAAA